MISGDIGGRCSECMPGHKGDKGERGFDGIPGPVGMYLVHKTLTFCQLTLNVQEHISQ